MAHRTALNYELAIARAEESEALRRAHRLQLTGAAPGDLREAMQHAEACHTRSSALAREVRAEASQREKNPAPRGPV